MDTQLLFASLMIAVSAVLAVRGGSARQRSCVLIGTILMSLLLASGIVQEDDTLLVLALLVIPPVTLGLVVFFARQSR